MIETCYVNNIAAWMSCKWVPVLLDFLAISVSMKELCKCQKGFKGTRNTFMTLWKKFGSQKVTFWTIYMFKISKFCDQSSMKMPA